MKWSYWTLPNVVKTDVEIHSVVSTLPNVVQFNVEIHNVVSTLLNVVNFNVDVYNVASTMIWRCATSRRHVNLKATLNRCWNVCWVTCICICICIGDKLVVCRKTKITTCFPKEKLKLYIGVWTSMTWSWTSESTFPSKIPSHSSWNPVI